MSAARAAGNHTGAAAPPCRRAGFSLAETSVTLALASVILAALAGAVQTAERLARNQAERVAASEALRVAEVVLGAELRALEPREDLGAVARDSLPLRAFRGVSLICARSADTVWVRYRGSRDPEPSKDSVLVLDRDALGRALSLADDANGGVLCPADADETLRRWTLPLAGLAPALLLLFESGSYHLAGQALRYRRGAAGRQPLTTDAFDPLGTGFQPVGSGGELVPPDSAVAMVVAITRTTAPAAFRLRIPFLNRLAGEGIPAP
ncbi:MAG: hypothetical protein HY561_03080 [Gemmatimonadetes bacterium]|nr:hypothetical protein [Gemmatimonadota bacterium]